MPRNWRWHEGHAPKTPPPPCGRGLGGGGGAALAPSPQPPPARGGGVLCIFRDRLPRRPGARTAPLAAPWRRHAGRPAVLPADRGAVSARHRARARDTRPHRPRHRLGLRPAGRVAAAGPAVRRRLRGWLARPVAAVRPAASGDRSGQGDGALAGHRPAAADRGRAAGGHAADARRWPFRRCSPDCSPARCCCRCSAPPAPPS